MTSLRPCLGCGALVRGSGRCRACAHGGWPDRGSAASRGLGWTWTRSGQEAPANPALRAVWRQGATVDHVFARAFGGTTHRAT